MGVKLLPLILLAAAMAATEAQPLEGCLERCGNVEIPYPFGVGFRANTSDDCFLDSQFNLTCENSTLLLGNLPVSSISFLEAQMDISMFVSRICYNQFGAIQIDQSYSYLEFTAFTISSTKNKFVSIGCDTYGYLNSFQDGHIYSTGCLSRCDEPPPQQVQNISETCSGVGCCQVDIPPGMRNITFESNSFKNHTERVWEFNNCSYAFVARHGSFDFNLSYLKYLPFNKSQLVVDWSIPSNSCEIAQSSADYACKYSNTDCVNSTSGYGYNCKCKPGFDGNPYHPDGCRDIDECDEWPLKCVSKENCLNKNGSYECFCPDGHSGSGTVDEGCHPSASQLTLVFIGVSAGLVALITSVSWVCLIYQKRKLIKQKQKFFRQNGGFILQQRLSVKETSSQTAKIFTAEELKKATKDYNDSLIIGTGGFGTVYKGILADNQIVAIKKSQLVHQNQTEQFINEIVILSQINHRNVVKLLGCCLETEVPLLVYEFVNNGTLFDYIHKKSKASNVSWETHLRIAAEVAGALSYLHSSASIPIIHRDVKPSNILLDENYTAKVSDFGASKLVPLDQTELATMMQGTFGYLDPEYMQTNQLTEKSDVYSFGVVLVELLTGKKALSLDRPEEERCLAMHFLSSLKQGQLFDMLEVGIVNDENKEILMEVALLAERCLRLRGDERPSMKEVAMEIEGIRMTWRHSWVNKQPNLEETRPLLGETSGINESDQSISYRSTGWDSIGHLALVNLDDGR